MTERRPDDGVTRGLMARYQVGEVAAFDDLYAVLVPAVRSFLRRSLQHDDRVEDLVQETFLQIHRARHTYDPAFPVMPWVLAIARHVWLMDRRTISRRPMASADVSMIALSTKGDAGRYADVADLHTALRELPVDKRQPVVWHHVWGLSFKQIARRLGVRADAAKLRSSRGISQLRHYLGAQRPLSRGDERE